MSIALAIFKRREFFREKEMDLVLESQYDDDKYKEVLGKRNVFQRGLLKIYF